ncbi:MAG: TlpA family protein disulfide reductase [Bacteroidetes bacterium]|nr:MAG: TlpA family protein disulfide reductase [Bacteroidota bacterium]
MKTEKLLAILLSLFFNSAAQSPISILKASYIKCLSIDNGYYELERNMKFMDGPDTSKSIHRCHFKKLKDDTLFSAKFHLKTIYRNKEEREVLYDGEDFITAYSKDSSGTFYSKTLWADEIKSIRHNFHFFTPFTKTEKSALPGESDLVNPKNQLKFINEESINGSMCYHVQLNKTPENDSLDEIQTFRIEQHYWISKADSIPMQYSVAYDMVMNNDSMYQYELITLKKYDLNNIKDEKIFKLHSLPEYTKLKNYVPIDEPQLLANDSQAPYWELTSLKDEKINLTDLKGSLVLVDFFYKSCYYCMLALPGLEELHQQYKDKGLKIVGINPFDEKDKGIVAFLEKRGVTYTVLLGGLEAAKEYHVTGYPTVYLIDKSGKIIFSKMGFTEELKKELEQLILKNL